MVFAGRMSALAEGLSKRLMDGGSIERRDLSTQLLTLSRYIDHAVASNQKPSSQQSILKSFKQFAYFKYDEMLRPSIMVLMLSVKSACLAGWFKESDVEELLKVFKYLFDYFLLDGECWKPPAQSSMLGPSNSSEMADPESFISTICGRYYPRLMLLSVIVSLTAKPGYEARGCDFQVTSQLAPYTKLRLFVCQRDAIGTSACLVTPPLLSILVNGKGVERRMYLPTAVEAGPQLPSDITSMLRIGCNFLQVLGECTANYFMAVVIMGSMPWSASSVQLEEYVIPPPSAEADDEVIVGHSRVSLRCPISHKRITTPAKGVSCRHHQAFDYDSYMEINDRRPSWRCPCCNGYVNCSELRLDRQMEQILREVDENLFDVMINHDGSWAPDVAADEIDGAHVPGIGQSPGDNVMRRLEESVINVSDDEEDEEGNERGGILVSPREPFVGTTTIDLVDIEDRKPDIRSMYISEEVVRSDATHAAVPVDVSNRDALESPVMNAIYSPIPETLDQAGLATATNARSVQILHGAARNTVESTVANLSSWPPVSGFAHSSSLPTGGQSSDNRLSPTESQLYPQPSRTPVIQALPAQTHYTNPNDRARFSPSVVSNNPAVAGEGPLPSSPDYDVQALHQQQQQMHNSDMADMLMMRELRQQAINNINSARLQQHMDSTQRSQGQGQRVSRQQGVVQNGLGNVRDARTQQFAGSHQAGQVHQNSNQQGQQFQYPVNAPQQSTGVPHPVQEYWQRQGLSQRIQQHLQQASSSPRGSPGGVTLGNTGSLSRGPRFFHSHPAHPGVSHSVANTAAVTSNSSTGVEGWVPPPQTSNWRSAGAPRMRGAIGGGSTAGMSAGVRGGVLPAMAQPGPVNRMRAPPNAVSPIPPTQVATTPTPTTMLWEGRGNPAGSELYSVPETLSTTTLVQDISWPTTVLESSQIDNGGPPSDPVYWMDETLLMPSSPQGQSQLF